jgi:hypothetical protein
LGSVLGGVEVLDFVEFFVETAQKDQTVSVNEADMQLAVHFVI